jgi:hypothetical protein
MSCLYYRWMIVAQQQGRRDVKWHKYRTPSTTRHNEEPRLSPNDKVNGESRLQEKHKRRARLHKNYNKNLILNCQKITKYHKNEDYETISDKSYTCTICN